MAQESQDAIFEIIANRYQKEDDLIQRQIERLEELKDKDIAAINASTENQQTRQAQIALEEKKAATDGSAPEKSKADADMHEASTDELNANDPTLDSHADLL